MCSQKPIFLRLSFWTFAISGLRKIKKQQKNKSCQAAVLRVQDTVFKARNSMWCLSTERVKWFDEVKGLSWQKLCIFELLLLVLLSLLLRGRMRKKNDLYIWDVAVPCKSKWHTEVTENKHTAVCSVGFSWAGSAFMYYATRNYWSQAKKADNVKDKRGQTEAKCVNK